MRRSEPSFGDTVALVTVEAREENLAARGIEFFQNDKDIQIVSFGCADPDPQAHAANQFRGLFESVGEYRLPVSARGLILHVAFRARGLRLQTARICAEIKSHRLNGWKRPTLF